MVSAFSRDIGVFVNENLSVAARQRIVAEEARKILAQTTAANRHALGGMVSHETYVDGRKGAALESVNVERGRIVFEFDLLRPALGWIGEQLLLASPVLTGRYRAAHVMLVNGVALDPGADIPQADEYVFVNAAPYARKIERGQSGKAPDGVYQKIARSAAARFGSIARIRFVYRQIVGAAQLDVWAKKRAARAGRHARQQFAKNIRQPAIVVTSR